MANFGVDRYELAGLLTQTPRSSVFRARELATGEAVALKILHGFAPEDDGRVLRKYREADAVRRLSHPRIARHIAFDRWNESYFVVEELCEGFSLAKALGNARWSLSMTLEMAVQLAEALSYCHERDLPHLGLHPGNILIETPPDGSLPTGPDDLEIRLLGVGQSVFLKPFDSRDEPPENLVYRSPEQTGIVDEAPGLRSDIYSLGVVLYRALTGRTPYESGMGASVLERMVTESLRPPRVWNSEIPRALDSIVMRAMAKNPQDRFASVGEFLSELRALRGTLPDSGDDARRGELELLVNVEHRLPLTERGLELKRLCTQFDQAAQGRGSLFFVTGESGSGKTRLVEELRTHVLAHRGMFLWCQASEFDSNRPFSPLRDAVRQFVHHINGLPDRTRVSIRRGIESAVGNFGRELVKSIPEIEELLPEAPEIVSLEPERERQRATRTILNLLCAIGGPSHPVVIFIDDYQWVDKGTKDVIERLRRKLGNAHLFVICAVQQSGGAADPEEHDAPTEKGEGSEAFRIRLGGLSPAGCRRLFEAAFGQEGPLVNDLATVAFERCGGNPRLLLEVVRTLRQEPIDLGSKGSSRSLLRLQTILPDARVEDFVRRRLEKLSPETRKILSAAAVIGCKFSLPLVERVSGAPALEVRKAVAEGLNLQIVASWSVLGEDWHCFPHERVHEEIYRTTSPRERLALHRLVAEALEDGEKEKDSSIYEIALHYLRSDDPFKAHVSMLKAARAAKKAYANREAIFFFSEALKRAPREDKRLELRILEHIGDACALDGQYESAEESYQKVLEAVEDPVHKARLEGRIGDMHFRRGLNESAIEHLKRGLAWLGLRSPRTKPGVYCSIFVNGLRQLIQMFMPRALVTLHNRHAKDIGREAVAIFHSLAYAYYFLDLLPTLEVHLRQLNLSERLGDTKELAHTYSSHGIVCSLIPFHGRAYRYQLRGLEIRKRLGDRWGIGQSYAFLGVCCLYRGEIATAIEYLRKSIRILESMGDQWEIEAAYYHLGVCYTLLGDVDASEDVGKTLLNLSREIQDLKFISISQISLAECHLIRGNLDRALNFVESALKTVGDKLTLAMALRVKGQVLLRLNRRREAVEVLEEGIALIRRHGLRNEYLVMNYIAYAQAYLADVDTILAMDSRDRARHLARARTHIRIGLRMARKFRNHLGYALRVRATYHRLLGSSRRADRDFDESRRVLEAQGRSYELGLTLSEMLRWKARAGELDDREEVDRVVEIFRKVGARLDLESIRKLADFESARDTQRAQPGTQHQQLSSLFKMSLTISSILDVDLLVTQITDLAIEFTGGERGYLFLRGSRGRELRCARGFDRKDIPREVSPEHEGARTRAWQSGLTQVVSLTDSEGREEGSGVCVPLLIGESTFGLVYIENRLLREVYTEEDLDFLKIFASQAAISLQNAFSYQKVEELNLGLERKVKERTRELLQKKQELENANRLKSEFLANMSHELRTPLNAVIAMSEILLEKTFGELTDKQETYQRQILDSGVHLLSLINDVLDLSKIEAGQLELNIDLLNLDELLANSLVVVKERASRHGITLRFEPGTDQVPVPGDARRIKQLVFNLLSNAVKFTPDAGRVTMSTRYAEDHVVVCVEDTGIGISRDKQKIIFDEFRQVDSSYSRRYEGTGLGLTLCRRFVELHGGELWVESEEGAGSRFCFSLPLHSDAVPETRTRIECDVK